MIPGFGPFRCPVAQGPVRTIRAPAARPAGTSPAPGPSNPGRACAAGRARSCTRRRCPRPWRCRTSRRPCRSGEACRIPRPRWRARGRCAARHGRNGARDRPRRRAGRPMISPVPAPAAATPGAHAGGARPAGDHAGEHVGGERRVAERAVGHAHVGDAGHVRPVRRLRLEPAFHEVRAPRRSGGDGRPAAAHAADSRFPHDVRHPAAADPGRIPAPRRRPGVRLAVPVHGHEGIGVGLEDVAGRRLAPGGHAADGPGSEHAAAARLGQQLDGLRLELRRVSRAFCHGSIISHRVRGNAEQKSVHLNQPDQIRDRAWRYHDRTQIEPRRACSRPRTPIPETQRIPLEGYRSDCSDQLHRRCLHPG